MPASYLSLNGSKIAPFKYGYNLPYGALINTTKAGEYPVKQDILIYNSSLSFVWPSSEHAYHAQKIMHLMSKAPKNPTRQQILIDTLRQIERTKANPGEEFLPRDDWDPIVINLTKNYPYLFGADKKAFDALCDSNHHHLANPNAGLMPNGEPYIMNFMRTVVNLKLVQNPALKQLAIDCAREGILPIEVSQYDNNWASGPHGTGANMLGIVILELGNQYLSDIEPHTIPAIPNPKNYYLQLQNQNLQQLSHNSLVPHTTNMTAWTQITPSTEPQTLSYVYSQGGNRRLVIQANTIADYEYRDNPAGAWKQSGDPSRYNDLINLFKQRHPEVHDNQPLVVKKLSKIDTSLQTLRDKIGQTNHHHFPEAMEKSLKLLQDLQKARDNYKTAMEQPNDIHNSTRIFNAACTTAINAAKPTLERDLGLGEYLKNLAKALANAVIGCFSSNPHSFYTLNRASSVKAVEEIGLELQKSTINQNCAP